MDRKAHWEDVYRDAAEDDVSWFQEGPQPSLRLLEAAAPSREARILDVGGGHARLVDALLETGRSRVEVLDISGAALTRVRERLGARAARVAWHETDVLAFEPANRYDVWHDRAVLHFLTRPEEQAAYARALGRALAPGGAVILGVFAPDGPEKCSGLPVARHDAESLSRLLGPGFELVETFRHTHVTPWNAPQRFVWARFRRRAA